MNGLPLTLVGSRGLSMGGAGGAYMTCLCAKVSHARSWAQVAQGEPGRQGTACN